MAPQPERRGPDQEAIKVHRTMLNLRCDRSGVQIREAAWPGGQVKGDGAVIATRQEASAKEREAGSGTHR